MEWSTAGGASRLRVLKGLPVGLSLLKGLRGEFLIKELGVDGFVPEAADESLAVVLVLAGVFLEWSK